MNSRVSRSLFIFFMVVIYCFNSVVTVSAISFSKSINGYDLLREEYVETLKSKVLLYEHKKSGAKIIHIKNDSKLKLFDITFKVPTVNNKGTNHILEHIFFSGSEKYPIKDVFPALFYLNNLEYINAATDTNYVTYYVSSRDNNQLKTIIDYYLSALFYPIVYKEENIFKQEGWRFELEEMNSPLKLTGVVLNEMKGYVFNNEFYKSIAAVDSLYKGAPGSFNGGGDPYVIPELTLEELLESHKKYYVPSNCLVILYGDIDTNEVLKFMDKEHLSLHDRKEQIQEYNISDNLSEKVYTNLKYPVPERENRNNKHIFINSFATGSINDVRESFAIKFLVSMMGAEFSGIEKRFNEMNIGTDFSIDFRNVGSKQSYVMFSANSEQEFGEEFEKFIYRELENFRDNILNEEYLENYYNITSNIINRKITDTPDSFVMWNVINAWSSGGDIIDSIRFYENLEYLKEYGVEDFINIIDMHFINNKHSAFVTLEPDFGIIEEKERILREGLNNYKESMSENEKVNLINETNDFNSWIEQEDSMVVLEKLSNPFKNEHNKLGDAKVQSKNGIYEYVWGKIGENDFINVSLNFDSRTVPKSKLHYLALFSDLMKEGFGTYDKTNIELMSDIKQTLFNLNITLEENLNCFDGNIYNPTFRISFDTTKNNLDRSVKLLNEFINNINFKNVDLLQNNFNRLKFYYESNLINPSIVYYEIDGSNYDGGKYKNYVKGLPYIKFLINVFGKYGEDHDFIHTVNKEIQNVSNTVFNINNLKIGVVSNNENYKLVKKNLESNLLPNLRNNTNRKYKYKFDAVRERISIKAPSPNVTLYALLNFKASGRNYTPKFLVAESVLGEYLYRNMRVKNGAYQVNSLATTQGTFAVVAGFSPVLKEQIKVVNNIGNYLSEIDITESLLEKYKIITISSLANTCDEIDRAKTEVHNYLIGMTKKEFKNMIDEIKSTTIQDIKSIGKTISDIGFNKIGVFGNMNIIEDSSKNFSNIFTLPLKE
ncbi:hypothetical protein SFBM_0494 [Candidatus Arthromitus sp. SFB-mouse-Japan]|uniref:insulinase family protein n=1 Tax=unclassified Candidatus Neoarthromitus TaxID=2638829 RepID=UPI00021B7F03|nr:MULTISPECIES: insulinase family protein [unclassified Candidatus Arthromitus]EIA24011.1 Putative peptidase [Candidatus Arthromitus sp. SFB-2]EIA26123.1 Putative peptidase [Candidatus Arthromitus sp. SFB-5]EIA27181.1 Putative peptidase [Candidatus Arthromitus sp. SFB-co]EIA30543.1 Putative peptidase [Candidatus Arthromitus sp. SFB-mouse-SU]AID44441.1 Hypothetical protein, TonB-dependent receptor [Candidatus Arthromitus sp. SFB-mouse-NL]